MSLSISEIADPARVFPQPNLIYYPGDTRQGAAELDGDLARKVFLGMVPSEYSFRAGVLLADEKGVIRFKNHQATILLDESSVIGMRDGRLRIDRASVQRSFEQLFQRTLAWDGSGERSSELLGIPDRTG